MAPAAVRIWRLWIVMGQQAFGFIGTGLFDIELFSMTSNYMQAKNGTHGAAAAAATWNRVREAAERLLKAWETVDLITAARPAGGGNLR